MMYPENDPQGQLRAAVFRAELEKAGWTVGGNLQVDFHWGTGDAAWVRSAATQLLSRRPNVVVANGDAAAIAAQQATLVPSDPATNAQRGTVIALAASHRLPVIYALRPAVVDGGLMSYGVDIPELFRRAARYADRILKGEKPADLPVQLPTKFERVINLKIAKALGFEVPTSLLATADEVIE
jgi:ABC-type uncharacterized transport system substrate-binding protein